MNDTDLELLESLVPKRDLLFKQPQYAKKLRLAVDPLSYWMATNTPRDNILKQHYFARFGPEQGLPATGPGLPQPYSTAMKENSCAPHPSSRSCSAWPPPWPTASRSARIVKYHANDIVNVRAKMRYTTLIELPSTEKILEVATGDKDFWIIDTVGNYCFLHPAKEGIHSNLNLITDKGTVYSFTLDDVEIRRS